MDVFELIFGNLIKVIAALMRVQFYIYMKISCLHTFCKCVLQYLLMIKHMAKVAILDGVGNVSVDIAYYYR